MGHFNIGDKVWVSDNWFNEYKLYTVSEKEYHGETNIYYFKETNYSAFEEEMTLSEVKERCPMINQEEYEILKGLDDKWKWIARHGVENKLNVYELRPIKSAFVEWWLINKWSGFSKIVPIDLFQFIQWEDEEPHYIPDLISDYEGSIEYAFYKINEAFSRAAEAIGNKLEGEEVKDIEWAKKEVKELMTEESQNYPHDEMVEKEVVLGILNQLDEPEKPVVPKFVAEWLTEARDDSLYGLLEKVNHLITTDYKWREWWERKVKGETFSEVQSIIAKAVINGYKVEKEPKYCVVFPEIIGRVERYLVKNNDSGNLWIDGDLGYIKESAGITYKFTEQEIKDYDERFWAFAIPVEEME